MNITPYDISVWILPLDITDPDNPKKTGDPEIFVATDAHSPAFSLDGRWLAYSSTESGRSHIYVQRYPRDASDARSQVSTTTSGFYPAWSPTRSEIFFQTADGQIMAADYTVSRTVFSARKPHLWSDRRFITGPYPSFDVARDGKRLIILPRSEPGGATGEASLHFTFLINFGDELKRRFP